MEQEVYSNLFETEQKHWWYAARREILTEIINYLQLPVNPSLLEIGSGTGGNLEMLSAFGSLDAVDMSDEAILLTKERFGSKFEVWKGALPDDLPEIDKQYDLICLLDVLEHIKDDKAALESICPLLKENGKVIITVPAYSWLWSSHDVIAHHQQRYSKNSLLNTVPLSLYKIKKISFYNSFLFPLAVIARGKDIFFKSKTPTGATIPSSFINSILKKIFSFEKRVINRCKLPFGLSLYLILEKNSNHI